MRLRSCARRKSSDSKVEIKVDNACLKKGKKKEKLNTLKHNEPVVVKRPIVAAKKISYRSDHRKSSDILSVLKVNKLSLVSCIKSAPSTEEEASSESGRANSSISPPLHQDEKDSVVNHNHLITSTSTIEKPSGDDRKPNRNIFKRRAIVASTPLVSSLPCNERQTTRLETNLSGSYWSSADSQLSQLSKSSIRDDSVQTSAGRKSRPIRKLEYFPEDNVATKKAEAENIPQKKRRVSISVKKINTTMNNRRVSIGSAKKMNTTMKKRRLSTSGRKKGNPYRRGSLVKSYLSNASNFSIAKSGTETKAAKPPCLPSKPEPLTKDKTNKPTTVVKYQSFAMEKFLSRQTFTSINSKVSSNQSFAYLPDVSYLPSVGSNLNKTEVSLLGRKRKKKLYTHKSDDTFNASPGIEPESLLNPSTTKNSFSESRKGRKNISFKTNFKDIIEDSDKENEEFSSIKVDEEISFPIETNTFDATSGENKSEVLKETSLKENEGATENPDFIIHSRPKTITSIETINEKFNGSYLSHPKERCIADNNERSKIKVLSCSLKTISETDIENEKKGKVKESAIEGGVKEGANEECKVKEGFKKKKLFQKKEFVFDLEASNEGNTTFNPNMTCNQSIMASTMNFN